MKDMQQLNEVFTRCFLKDWKNITPEENKDLITRRNRLNKNFKFTDEVIMQLRRLDELLKREEDRISRHEKALKDRLKKWVAEKIISDYEIAWEIQCWNEGYYKQWNAEFDGNPFFTDYIYSPIEIEDDDTPGFPEELKKIETDPVTGETVIRYNWNDLSAFGHPLAKEFYCYMTHHLIDHNHCLAWEDILRIETIWIEMKVYHQFVVETGANPI